MLDDALATTGPDSASSRPRRAPRMSETVSSDRLNDLLIDMGRSLLQYVGESWPWSGSDAQELRQQIDELTAEQREMVRRLAELLDERHHRIDFGTYPTEYTSLHYVSLAYLLDELIENQQAVVEQCEDALRLAAASVDPEASALLDEIVSGQRRALRELRALAHSRSNGAEKRKPGGAS